jgi:HAE1 family hydrophobic/amphiphilic exporter-1
MTLSDMSIRRPVFAVMMTVALIVLGLFSYRDLGLDLMPKTDFPNVMITVRLPGASAEEVETLITKPIEEAVNSINGIDEMRAYADQGLARVNIMFVLSRNIDAAVQDVRDKVATVSPNFPRDTLPPVIAKIDPESSPVITIVVSGNRSQQELTALADKQIKQVLETVADVGQVTLQGDRRREIQLLLNADRMAAYALTIDKVRSAVQRQNVDVPGGTFIAEPEEIALRTMGRIQRVADFNQIVLAYKDGSAVTFGDVGRAVDTIEEVRSLARLNGRPAIAVDVVKQSGTNTVAVVDRVLARLETIQAILPPDVVMEPIRDQSRFIRRSFDDIKLHLIFGGLLASVVVYLFIRNVRATIIAALAIPASIIGTFTVMKALGFTLDNMTMLALSLATGIVIDDAIVVLENIFRFVEEKGMTPREAASKATDEIGLAVLATTLSLVVIFVPVAFMTGQVGRYFYSFGLTSAAAILISMFISFTLTPALCAIWLRRQDAAPGHGAGSTRTGAYAAMDRVYGRMLSWSLGHRAAMIGLAIAITASAALMYPYIGQEVAPDDDQSEFTVSLRVPPGASFARAASYVDEIERDLKTLPEVDVIFTTLYPGNGNFLANFFVGLKPLGSRTLPQQELMRRTRAMLRRYQDVRLGVSGGSDTSFASRGGGAGGGGGNRLNMNILGPDIAQLHVYSEIMIEKFKTIPGAVDVATNVNPTQPELRVVAHRGRAADLGVSIDALASNLRTLVGGERVSHFRDGDDQLNVVLRLDEPFRNPATMGDLLVPAAGGVVRVSDVAQLSREPGTASIDRFNREHQISVSANLDNVALGDALDAARAKVAEAGLKPGYHAVFGGSAKTLDEASNDFTMAVLLAVAFIYMVLASQFNSLTHPLTIMTALPLSLPAGLLALVLFGMTLNVYSAIGLIMLFGIVKKNSILQVDYTNALRAAGMPRHEALIMANHVRLRPILMTTIAIIAGMIPIAFGRGEGAGSRASMAVTIIGGQCLCLLLTLLVTPVVYSCFDDLQAWSAARSTTWRFRRTAAPRGGADGVL